MESALMASKVAVLAASSACVRSAARTSGSGIASVHTGASTLCTRAQRPTNFVQQRSKARCPAASGRSFSAEAAQKAAADPEDRSYDDDDDVTRLDDEEDSRSRDHRSSFHAQAQHDHPSSSSRPRRSSRTLLLDPDDAESAPTLAALDRLRPKPFVRRRKRIGEDSFVPTRPEVELAERTKHYQAAARRVHQAFTKAQLLQIARDEIPAFSKRRDFRRHRASPSERNGPQPRVDDSMIKPEIIKRIMRYHWNLPEPATVASKSLSRDSMAPALEKQEEEAPAYSHFYPLDVPQLYIVLTTLKDRFSELTHTHKVRHFPAQRQVEHNEAQAEASSDSAAADSTSAPGTVQQGMQFIASDQQSIDEVKRWLDIELARFAPTSLDLAPIYAADSQGVQVPPEKMAPPASLLREIALRSFSFVQSEGSIDPESVRLHLTANEDGLPYSTHRYPCHPATLLRRYAIEQRDQAGRPLFYYTPVRQPSEVEPVASLRGGRAQTETKASTPSQSSLRTRYALNPHQFPRPRSVNVAIEARARRRDFGEAVADSSDAVELKRAMSRLPHVAAVPRWRLERSMVSDALEGRGGLGFSLGYGPDLDQERSEAAAGGGDEDLYDETSAADAAEPSGLPQLLLDQPVARTIDTTTPVALIDVLSSSSSKPDSSPVAYTYSATFGHLRFPSILPVDPALKLQSVSRTALHGLFIPPIPGSWPIGKLKRTLAQGVEAQASASPGSRAALLEAQIQLQRPVFQAALPPAALLPSASVSSTLSAANSTSAAGDAWTRLMARAFGDISTSIVSPQAQSSRETIAKRPGAVLLEAYTWMRDFRQRRSKAGRVVDSRQRTTTDASKTSKDEVKVIQQDLVRFSYVPAGPADREAAPGRRLVFEALPSFTESRGGQWVAEFTVSKSYWETEAAQADVAVPDGPIDLRMARVGTLPADAELVYGSDQLRDFLTGTDRSSGPKHANAWAMIACYRRLITAPTDISLPLTSDPTTSADATSESTTSIQMQLEDASVLSRSSWPMQSRSAQKDGKEKAAQGEDGSADPVELEAWIVEESVYVDGTAGENVPTLRIEWRTPSSTPPQWAQLGRDLDLLLDVPYGVCKGRASYASL